MAEKEKLDSEEKKRPGLGKDGEDIREFGQMTLEHRIHLLSVIGEIEGHECLSANTKTTKYEHVLPQLAAIEESTEIKGLLVLLNTVGGDVEAGLAIAEMIASISKPTVSLVLGGGHSLVEVLSSGEMVMGALCLLFVVKFLFSMISFGSGAPGGIFLPLLVLGAIIDHVHVRWEHHI